eukprot:m.268552 g.268552  ORF g.268552 m.268552 type:complete len:57 (+) comp16256_c0_seq6:5805-5975(+)
MTSSSVQCQTCLPRAPCLGSTNIKPQTHEVVPFLKRALPNDSLSFALRILHLNDVS